MAVAPILHPQYDLAQVLASIFIAAIASFSALRLAERIGVRQDKDRWRWLVGGGAAMGLGIAAMHFVGMLATELPVVVAYDSVRTVASVVVAATASTIALALAGGPAMRLPRLLAGSVTFGGAIAGMHYIGMSAVRGAIQLEYDLPRVALSIVVAVLVAAVALALTFRLRAYHDRYAGVRRVATAIVMGLAVAGMHYTAMFAVHFHTGDPALRANRFDGPLLLTTGLAGGVVAVSLVILIGAIIASRIDQRARRELRETRLTLENRIAEHEAEAAMANELYCLLAENATDMVSTHEPDGRFAHVASSWSEFTGRPVEEIVGRLPIEFAHPDDVALLIANHTRALRSPDLITTLWRCRRIVQDDGAPEYAWVETKTRPVREAMRGRVQTFVCATRDVSERTRMEDELARSEARFRAALTGSFDSFVIVDAVRNEANEIVDFAFAELNPRAEAMLGHVRGNVIGCHLSEVCVPGMVPFDRLTLVAESRIPLEDEMEWVTDDGVTRWFHHQLIPLGDGVAVTSRDVTDRKQAEEELRALTLGDDLTRLYNRRGFRMLAEQHLRLVKRGGPLSLLVCFDVDGFKSVNDVYGHAEGDEALRRVGEVLRTAFRDSDIMARMGGDEFVVLALDCGDIREHLLARVRNAAAASNLAAGRAYALSLSVGTAWLDPLSPMSLDALMAEADANLYEAKRRRVAA